VRRPKHDVRVSELEVAGEHLLVVSIPLPKPALAPLSETERDVMLAKLAGRSNAEIAEARGRSTRTIANQVASIYRKLGVSSRAELAAWAAQDRLR